MNILYLETKRNVKNSGGAYITDRNKTTLSNFTGCNFLTFSLDPYKRVLTTLFYALFGYSNGFRFFTNFKLKKIIKRNKIDILFVDISSMGRLSDWIYKNTKVLQFFQNVEYLYSFQEIKNKTLIKKKILMVINKCIYNNEKKIAKFAAGIITLNKRDSNELKKNYKRESDFIWPTTFKDSYKNTYHSCSEERYMLFVGSYFYGNVEGLSWFVEKCLPYINLKMVVVGSGMEQLKSVFTNKNIEVLGFVDDLSYFYYNAEFVVLPIISGSGMKTKTCEAFMYGKTVFGTEEAFEGYESLNSSFAIVCKDEKDFIKNINNYLEEDHALFNKDSRNYFLSEYENTIINKRVYQYIQQL